MYQESIVLAFDGDVTHTGHDAERSENEHDDNRRGKQAADAVVDATLGLGELLDPTHVGFWQALPK